MKVTGFHVCTEAAPAPTAQGAIELGTRWVCECGANFVFREGFSPAGHLRADWWPAPALIEQRKPRSLRQMLVRPRQGD